MSQGALKRPRVLVAGIGNIFLGDDAFGVEVVQRLLRQPLPDGVRVVDFGIRGLDLAFALLDDYEAVILVDAMPHGGQPGTLYVLEPNMGPPSAPGDDDATKAEREVQMPLIETHNLDPARVLDLVASMGGKLERIFVVGCEPNPRGENTDDGLLEICAPVKLAVGEAVSLIQSMVADLLKGGPEMTAVVNCEIN